MVFINDFSENLVRNRFNYGSEQFEYSYKFSSVDFLFAVFLINSIVEFIDEKLSHFSLFICATKAFFQPGTDSLLDNSLDLQYFTLDKDLKHELSKILVLDK